MADANQADPSGRRALDFDQLDQVAAEVRHLHESGYQLHGNWNLAQICGHLNEWMRFPLDGYPPLAWPMRWAMPLVRLTIGRRMGRQILRGTPMRRGVPTLASTVPEPDRDEALAVEQLCDTITRLRDHSGPLHRSPVFGDMDRESTIRLQLVHSAHHLRFLVPNH